MEILAPHTGLILWTIFSIVHLVLCIIVIIKLANTEMSFRPKVFLLLAIIFIPLFGPVMFFAFRKAKKLRTVA